MEDVLDLRSLLLAITTCVAVVCFFLVNWEIKAYKKRKSMRNISMLTMATASRTELVPIRGSAAKLISSYISRKANIVFKNINLVRRLSVSIRGKVLRAGIQSKDAVTYILVAKILGVFLIPIISVLAFNTYSMFSKNIEINILGSMISGFFLPDLLLFNLANKRQQEITKHWADILDVILISVTSGKSIEVAIRLATFEMSVIAPELAKEFTITLLELSLLENRTDAYRRMAERLPLPFVRNFVFDVIQSEKLGTPLGLALRNIAAENRSDSIQRLEMKAAALGPKLTVPMILFFFPLLFIVILVPVFL